LTVNPEKKIEEKKLENQFAGQGKASRREERERESAKKIKERGCSRGTS